MSQLHGTITPARPENPANPETSRQEGQYEITVPSWQEKLVGEVVHLLLEAIYEPTFSSLSHGFRKGRGCHTALRDIRNTWTGTVWFIEADISDCFTRLDHEILLGILGERIHDNRFLRLIRNMLKAGYLEDWEYHETLSGVPQGGVVSPVLSNIYLNKLDEYVERELIPKYTRGESRKPNYEYVRVTGQLRRARQRGDRAAARTLTQQVRALPAGDPNRRTHLNRACDLFTGIAAEYHLSRGRAAIEG